MPNLFELYLLTVEMVVRNYLNALNPVIVKLGWIDRQRVREFDDKFILLWLRFE